MRRTLPPPIALRAFESAARLLSFTRAAEELNVTQAAVSHQIKVLEEFFGFPLFVRLTRKLMLTHEGQSLYAAANEGFGIIENTVSDLLTGRSDETLDISLTPYFSSRWLSPRLGRFWESHPNIDLRLHHTSQQELRPRENIDLSITWGLDDWPNLDSAPLLHARVVPVCSPSLVRGKRAIRTVDDLYRHNLLHETDYSLWENWLARMGATHIKFKRGSILDDANVLMQATMDGQGVALGSDVLCADDIAAGKLLMPFDADMSIGYAYYIVYRPGALKRPAVNVLYEWLMAECGNAIDR